MEKAICLLILFSISFNLFSADDTNGLKAQVEALQNRVTQLEQVIKTDSAQKIDISPSLDTNYDPFYEMNSLRSRINNMFEDSFSRAPMRSVFIPVYSGGNSLTIHLEDRQYIVEMELVGINKEDIDISIKGRKLTVSAKKSESLEKTDKKNNYQKSESLNYISRSIVLPIDADSKSPDAEYKNGILTIKFNRLDVAEVKPSLEKVRIR